MTTLFLLPLLGHFALVCGLYVWLTLVRQGAVSRGQSKLSDFVRADGDREQGRRIQRNLANQFEAPLFLYFAAALLVTWQAVTWFDVVAAWVFLIGRLIHTCVQTLTDNVALRGQVFTINFLAIVALMGHVAMRVVFGSSG